LDAAVSEPARQDIDLMKLDDALLSLSKLDEQQSRVVEMRFFGGLSIEETAEALGVSLSNSEARLGCREGMAVSGHVNENLAMTPGAHQGQKNSSARSSTSSRSFAPRFWMRPVVGRAAASPGSGIASLWRIERPGVHRCSAD